MSISRVLTDADDTSLVAARCSPLPKGPAALP